MYTAEANISSNKMVLKRLFIAVVFHVMHKCCFKAVTPHRYTQQYVDLARLGINPEIKICCTAPRESQSGLERIQATIFKLLKYV